jgi:small-conductance mechanosensitive channel
MRKLRFPVGYDADADEIEVRKALCSLAAEHRAFRVVEDPSAAHAFLVRLAETP